MIRRKKNQKSKTITKRDLILVNKRCVKKREKVKGVLRLCSKNWNPLISLLDSGLDEKIKDKKCKKRFADIILYYLWC